MGHSPTVKNKTIKFLVENIKENFCDLGLSKVFFRHDTKVSNDKRKLINLPSFKVKPLLTDSHNLGNEW